MSTRIRSFARSLGLSVGLAALAVAAGCGTDTYYCDATGCYSCDGIGCRYIPPPTRTTCRGDFECTIGHCTSIGCVATCSDGLPCPSGTTCQRGECLGPREVMPTPRPGTCTTTSDCAASGVVCINGYCARDNSCTSDTQCTDGRRCVAGECRAVEQTCRFNSECGIDRTGCPAEQANCGTPRVCINSRCFTQCDAATPCAAGFMCQAGACVANPPVSTGCTTNAQCGTGNVCVSGVCYLACTTDSMCGAGKYCHLGICKVDDRPMRACTSDVMCMRGHVCRNGACRTPCSVSADCARFDAQYNFCLAGFCATTNEATSDCMRESDCRAGQSCVNGVCR